jgi:hypothetical protein
LGESGKRITVFRGARAVFSINQLDKPRQSLTTRGRKNLGDISAIYRRIFPIALRKGVAFKLQVSNFTRLPFRRNLLLTSRRKNEEQECKGRQQEWRFFLAF